MIDSGDWGRAADRNIGTDGGVGAAVVDVWWDGGVGVEGYVEGAGVGVRREAKLWFDVDSGGGKDEACGGESGGEGASKTITDKVVGANFADADAFKNMVTKWIKWGAARAQRCRIGREEGKAEFLFNCCRKFPIGQTV